MDNLNDVNNLYLQKLKDNREKENKLKNKLEKIQKQIDKIGYIHIIDLFKPMAEKIKRRLKADSYDIYGPFGLCSATTFYWLKDKEKEITDKGNVLGSLCFASSGDGWVIRDETKNTEEFSSGTIGEVNGMNYPIIEITDKMDMKWLLKFIVKTSDE